MESHQVSRCLQKADLRQANLSFADLNGADLREANLSEADLLGADLRQADLTNTNIGWTAFGAVDLRNVKGLEMVKHEGPSTIGIDTIIVSQGKIPETFL